MPLMTLNRNFALATTAGHRIVFKKGEPTFVPPELIKVAAAIGADLVTGEDVEILEPEAPPVPQLVGPEREEAIFAALARLEAINVATDFLASGTPKPESIEREAGRRILPPVTRAEAKKLWLEYNLQKAEQ